MQCNFETPEQISACIKTAHDWLLIVSDLAGLGSIALLTILIWIVKRLRNDLRKWEEEAERQREIRAYAEEASRHAEHRASLAEREAQRLRVDAEQLALAVSASESELQKIVVETQGELSAIKKSVENAVTTTVGGDAGFWSRHVENLPDNYRQLMSSSIPCLMFGNQKGGVGKSTTVTNLAAAFAERGERVLTVDLDYQGSHSSLMQLERGEGNQEPESLVDYLFAEELDPNWPRLTIRKLSDNLSYIPAFYDFETIERKVEYQWALGLTSDDVRYRLARALLSPQVQRSFDRIIIDAPPRFTLGFINGLCAATHLYVPTVVDAVSARAVGLFAHQFKRLQPVVNPHVMWAGIVATMTFVRPQEPLRLPNTADAAAGSAERLAQHWLGTRDKLFIRYPVIKRDALLAQATEKGVAYYHESRVRPMFDALADVIEKRAPARPRGHAI